MAETFRTEIDELKTTINNLVDSNRELIKMILDNQHHNGAVSTFRSNHSNLIPKVKDNGETIPDLSDDLNSTSDTIMNVNTGKVSYCDKVKTSKVTRNKKGKQIPQLNNLKVSTDVKLIIGSNNNCTQNAYGFAASNKRI
ncbi:hypothetical protein HHI36_011314 [Cryptolaemus montrouzieri]|uniref:Uncharacterized protein n=1 Tax=Cryptolaemus montrouzieri TaxID=559131 RepID=A0ABD2MLP9_9CUCU